jgi:hypothetical protein
VFTPIHKPPYTYPYGRSIDETTTIPKCTNTKVMASPDPLLIRGFLFILVWNSIQEMTCSKQSLPHHVFNKPAVSSKEFTKSDSMQFFLLATPVDLG